MPETLNPFPLPEQPRALPKLLLIPTQPELEVLQPALAETAQRQGWSIELCGFGPIAAAARAAQLIARDQPSCVMLLGIAGGYHHGNPIGSASLFDDVACYGIGVGTGDDHQPAGRIGWPQWQEPDANREIGDLISLAPASAQAGPSGRHLLTCCAASADVKDVASRTQIHPTATDEDMEGFGVALACELAGVPLQIARGISNHAGDRNKNNWHVADALQAVAELARRVISQE